MIRRWLKDNWLAAIAVAALVLGNAPNARALFAPSAVSSSMLSTDSSGVNRMRRLRTAVDPGGSGTYERITSVAMNGAAGTRTVYINVHGWVQLSLGMDMDYTAASDLTATCTATYATDPTASATTYKNIPVLQSVSPTGVGTYTAFSTYFAITADANHTVRYDVSGFEWVKCVYAATGAGANDLLSTDGSLFGG